VHGLQKQAVRRRQPRTDETVARTCSVQRHRLGAQTDDPTKVRLSSGSFGRFGRSGGATSRDLPGMTRGNPADKAAVVADWAVE